MLKEKWEYFKSYTGREINVEYVVRLSTFDHPMSHSSPICFEGFYDLPVSLSPKYYLLWIIYS